MKSIFAVAFVFSYFFSVAQTEDSIKNKTGVLYYQIYGRGNPMILLSGGPGGSSRSLGEVAVTLGKKHRCILIQQRGTGKSTAQPFDSTTINLRQAIEDVRLVLDRNKLSKATLIGHSWGAMLAMAFASAYPSKVQALVLITPGPFKEWKSNNQIMQGTWRSRMGREQQMQFDSVNNIIQQGKAATRDSLLRRTLVLETYTFNKRFSDTVTQRINAASNLKMRDLMLADLGKHYDLSQSLKKFKGSIDVISCRQDYVLYNAYEIKLLIPSVRLHWLDECGHWPQFEQPDAFYATMNKILDL